MDNHTGVIHPNGTPAWAYVTRVDATSPPTTTTVMTAIAPTRDAPTMKVARAELERGLTGLVGAPAAAAAGSRDGVILLGAASDPAIARLNLPLKGLGDDPPRLHP